MTSRVDLGELRAVALSVQGEPADPEPIPDRLEVLRRLHGRVPIDVSRRDTGLREARVDKRLDDRSAALRPRVFSAGLGTVGSLGRPDAALVPEEDVVRGHETRVERGENSARLGQAALAGPADGDRQRPLRCGRRMMDRPDDRERGVR